MAPSQTEIESLIIELAGKSFKTFCDDISGMFGMDMACSQQEVTPETVNGLQRRFKDLEVVYTVKSEGALDGTFQLVFDKTGLFLLAGVVAMHPEQLILEDVESGTLEKAEKASNILKEVGTALAGSWDRIFRKEFDGHDRFVQTDTFIGNPWDNSEEKIGLNSDEELVLVPYEMTIGPYPAFSCGAIFPKAIFTGTSESGNKQVASADEKAQEQTENRDPNVSEPAEEIQDKAQEKAEESAAADDQAQPTAEETVAVNESAAKQESEAAAEQKPNDLEEEATTPAEAEKSDERPISEAIKQMTQSAAVSSDESTPSIIEEKPAISNKDAYIDVCAKDIMQKEVVWANPDDSVQQALAKIQQHNAGYMMIGKGQVPEGIVSMSDLTGAISPYLRSIFAKWRRPMDDATLRIRVKWIMSKPTCTISPETSLTKIMENMWQSDNKCLPVVDEQGKVRGLVTVFDIFRALL
ncbi:MAG: CBS domain-containing protein [Planctomycetota bacterium]|jgi:CBS domain-containing protein